LAHVLIGEQRFALANRIPLRRDTRWRVPAQSQDSARLLALAIEEIRFLESITRPRRAPSIEAGTLRTPPREWTTTGC
jgi:hypothetical protein